MTATEWKQWTIGTGRTAVALSWISDNENVVESLTAVPVSDLTHKQYDDQSDRIKKEINKVLGWEAESGQSEETEDGREQCGWWRVDRT